jgi:hypothetical protein
VLGPHAHRVQQLPQLVTKLNSHLQTARKFKCNSAISNLAAGPAQAATVVEVARTTVAKGSLRLSILTLGTGPLPVALSAVAVAPLLVACSLREVRDNTVSGRGGYPVPGLAQLLCWHSHLVSCTPVVRGVHVWATLQEAARGSARIPSCSRRGPAISICSPQPVART